MPVFMIFKDKYNGQKMPLPYKVAKSLDPVIYRNTAFDAWLATKKGKVFCFFLIIKRNNKYFLNPDDLTQKMISMMPGDKCLIRLTNEYRANWIVGIVQNITNNSATILLPELRQRYKFKKKIKKIKVNKHKNFSHCVTLDNIKPFNTDMISNSNHVHNVQKLVQPINAQFSLIFSNSRKFHKKKNFQN
jgi:hypothetical protein